MSARLVLLEGGSPWGFRVTGGADTGSLLRVSRVNPGSKAELEGVREGDVICAINGQSTKCISNSDAHALLKSSGKILSLSLNEEGSPRRKSKAGSKTDGAISGLTNGGSKETKNETAKGELDSLPENSKKSAYFPKTMPKGNSGRSDGQGSADTKTKSQIKRLKRKEKRRKKEQIILKETVAQLQDENWEIVKELSQIEIGTADITDETVAVSEVLVLDGEEHHDKIRINPEDERNLRDFLKTLDIEGTNEKSSKPVINIPDDIFEEFLQTEEMNQARETIKQVGVAMKTSPKARRKETSPVKYVTKMVDAPKKVLYSYTGLPILTPSIVTMEDLDDKVVVVHCPEDRGFQLMDVIPEEGSELSDSSKRQSRTELLSLETVKISEEAQCHFPSVDVKESNVETEQSNAELVFVENDDFSISCEGLKYIEDESGSSHAADDYEADVESAVESRRDTIFVDSLDEDEDIKTEKKFSRQDSTSSCTSTCTAKYLPPFSRSESEIDDWRTFWKSNELSQEIKEVAESVNVGQLKKALERDINPILISKLTVMQFGSDVNMHERTWNKVVESTKKRLEARYKNQEVQTISNPLSLAVLAKEVLLAMPNGLFLSRKIGLPLSCPSSPPPIAFSPFRRYSDTETCSELQFYNAMPDVLEFSCRNFHNDENQWYGMPTREPGLLVGLSPSQCKHFSQSQKRTTPTPQEAEDLLDLHQKFIERRSYAEVSPLLKGRNVVFDSSDMKNGHVLLMQERDGAKERLMGEMGNDSMVSAINLESEEGSAAKPCVLAPSQNATPYEQYATDLKRNASGAGARWGHEVYIMTTHNHAGKQPVATSQQESNGVARIILDRYMNSGQQTDKPAGDIETQPSPSVSDIIKAFETPPEPQKTEKEPVEETKADFITINYSISKNRDIAVINNEKRRHSLSEDEIFKQRMYHEYMSKLAERVERRQQNSIKICDSLNIPPEVKTNSIEEEFMNKVQERQRSKSSEKSDTEEVGSKRNSVVLTAEALPKHLKEFFELPLPGDDTLPLDIERIQKIRKRNFIDGGLLKEIDDALIFGKGFLFQKGDKMIGPTFKANAPRPGVWSPAQNTPSSAEDCKPNPVEEQRKKIEEEPIPPVWTPKSAQASPVAERKEFRPVNFQSPTLPRKNVPEKQSSTSTAVPPWKQSESEKPTQISLSSSLPRAPNPTVTLLQKAREGQIPRGAQYLNNNSMPEQDSNEYLPSETYLPSKNESDRPKRTELGPRQSVPGIGPTTKEGIPIVLRSEVSGENREKWYKRMYDSLHKAGKDDDFVTVKYRTSPQRRGVYGYHNTTGGYQSEPEPEERLSKYATLDRRRTTKNKENEVINVTLPRRSLSREPSRPPPGRIENYQPGHSSISDIEASKWWDEVLEIFDRWLDDHPGADDRGARQILAHAICCKQAEKTQPVHKTHSPKSFMTYALKESGYESEPQHVYKRREEDSTPLSPLEQKEAYKTIQKGGEIPLHGLRKAAPERPKDDTEIEYFPLSPTLTRIRVHKQNITPLGQFPFPSLPIPLGVCSSFSQVHLYPNQSLDTTCTKKGSVYQFSRSPSSGVKLQTVGEPDYVKIIPKPRKLSKKSPVYENLPAETPVPTFADLKRTAVSLVAPEGNVKLGAKTTKSSGKKTKKPNVPLSESVRREKPLAKVQKRLKTLPDVKKRRSELKKTEDSLTAFVEAEIGPGCLATSSDGFCTDDSNTEMNPIFDNMNPDFLRKHEDIPPYRSRSFSPGTRMIHKPSPPQRQSSRNNSTLRMWSKMMVTYPYHRSRIDSYESNVKYLRDRLQRRVDSSSKEEEFGDDVETVRTVKKDRDGQMTIKTNRFVKIARPVSAGPSRVVYDQNGRRVLSETRQPTNTEKTAEKKSEFPKKKPSGYVKSSSEEDKGRVKVTVAISSKAGPLKAKGVKKTVSKVLSPSTSVSSFRSVASGRSVASEKGSTASSLSKTTTPRVISPSSTVSRLSSVSRASTPSTSGMKKAEKTAPAVAPKTITKDPMKTKKISTVQKTPKQPTKIITKTLVKLPEKSVKKEPPLNSKSLKEELDLIEQTNQVRSDSFFQHLFLREPAEKKENLVERSSSVLERARRYQRSIERPQSPTKAETKALNLLRFFLAQKRPVSSSKFKDIDRELSASRSPSPTGRSRSFQAKIRKFDSGSQFGDDLISFSPDLKIRSSSEPPMRSSGGRQTPLSPVPSSCRLTEERVKSLRARSAGETESRATHSYADSNRSNSSLNLHYENPEYQAYMLEILHSTRKCERFRELHKFYASLERIAELEKTASIGDLRPRLRNEEIIDYDRWKRLRTKERAEAELKALVGKLSEIQKEKDIVFRTCDVEAVRWKGDRGLRAKERSVEDLKEQFLKKSEEKARKECSPVRDSYKPLWRGNSIVNLASNLNTTAASYRGRPVTSEELEKIKEAREKIIGNRARRTAKGYSSLSRDEVNVLKSQLSEIYSQELKRKSSKEAEEFVVSVPDLEQRAPGEECLTVKSCSKDDFPERKRAPKEPKGLLPLPWKEEVENKLSRPSSRGSSATSTPRSKSTPSKPLSESEKKRISLTLSKEVLEKSKSPKRSPILPRETMGAVANSKIRHSPDASTLCSPRTCYSFDLSEDGKHKNDFLLVLTPTEKDVAVENWPSKEERRLSSTTTVELESVSASSETSVRTVIKNPVDVLKKVEYFEAVGENKEPRSKSAPARVSSKINLQPSHSLENIREILGEEKKCQTIPVPPPPEEIISRPSSRRNYSYSPSDYRFIESTDSLFSFRSRSVSPDPTKYYRAYLRTVKGGAVQKIRNIFESLEDLLSTRDGWLSPMKKSASDPELTRDMLRRYGTDPSKVIVRGQETGDVQYLKTRYEKSTKSRRSPIPRAPFTVSDRYMPRINVISKTAELQLQKHLRRENELPASPEPFHSLTEYSREHGGYYYVGEVEKLRRKFEKLEQEQRMSLMGQMYTSTPDFNELRHIAPYLGCSWVAHQHPQIVKSSSSSPDLIRLPKSEVRPRPHSSSPVRPKQPSSILKHPSGDIFANQKFDPAIHRPKSRYQPEPISYSYDRRLRWSGDAYSQWNRPTVTFKGSALVV